MPANPIQSEATQTRQASQASLARIVVAQEASASAFDEWSSQFAVNTRIRTQARTLEERLKRREKTESAEKQELEGEEALVEVKGVEEIADEYSKKNPELKQRSLIILKERLKEEDSAEEILKKVLDSYPDPTLADEAMAFLQKASEEEFAKKIVKARMLLRERFEREIRAGRNILQLSQQYSKEGLDTAEGLRNMYREMTGNPKDPHELFNDLIKKYTFDQMRAVISFVLHSLGADLKSKGPSIQKGELFRLLREARTLQAILGVYRYFIQKQKYLLHELNRRGQQIPVKMHFETLAKIFMKYLQDRYPGMEKVFLIAIELGISSEVYSQEVLFTLFYDAFKHISPKLFRTSQHKQDVMMSFLDALDEVQDQIEEKEEKQS